MNTISPAVTATCGHTFLTGGPTNAKLRLLSRRLNTGKNMADQVSSYWFLSPNSLGIHFLINAIFGLRKISSFYFVCSGGFFVTGINLTEDLKYICTHPTESLKDLVMSTYPTLLSWVKEQTPGSKVGSINIIAGDFITESHFVPTVVTLNEKLLKWSSWLSTNLH